MDDFKYCLLEFQTHILHTLQWLELLYYTTQDIFEPVTGKISVLCHMRWISCLTVLKLNAELVNSQDKSIFAPTSNN